MWIAKDKSSVTGINLKESIVVNYYLRASVQIFNFLLAILLF
jgi:hypothetical protein